MPSNLPFGFTEQVQWILGQPNFAVATIAWRLKELGLECAEKAEDEQALALYWMLSKYVEYGEGWMEKANAELKAKSE